MSRLATIAILLTLATTAVPAERIDAPPERAWSAFSADPTRRFDFWIGEWDVNLRTLQDDLTFDDWITSHASIYSILGGKAILELWDSKPIKGFSLRYHDPTAGKWVLWLDWPSANRSHLSSLKGSFRHGRGDFRGSSPNKEGGTNTYVYSFNDITPFSLRWDDRFSSDGGKTWTHNWIMEFSRTAVDPVWPIRHDRVPTYVDGGRCDDERFRHYEVLIGSWRADGASFRVLPILDGCAVMGFLENDDGDDEFVFITFDSVAGHWVTAVLDDRPDTSLVQYTGGHWAALSAEGAGSLRWAVVRQGPGEMTDPGVQLIYRRGDREMKFERLAE